MARTQVLLMAGTQKGAFVLRSGLDRRTWSISGPYYAGWNAYHVNWSHRHGMLMAGVSSTRYGPVVGLSRDLGETWEDAHEGLGLPEDSGWKVNRVWYLADGPPWDPDALYAGIEQGALFRSGDGGRSWTLNRGLFDHPTRAAWTPGNGGLCLHTILFDPEERRVYVAISAAGVYRSDDGGETWAPRNRGTAACFLPDPDVEFGQCVHRVVMHPSRPAVFYQQNHCGVYRSDDRGETWRTIEEGLPATFGFAMAVHPRDPATLYVVPEGADESRLAVDGKFRVYRTRNGGERWEPLANGLPQEHAHLGVLRHGLATDPLDPCGVYVGTTTGQIFASRDEGESWSLLCDFLPRILSVEAAVVET